MPTRRGAAAVRGLRDPVAPGRHVRSADRLAQGLDRNAIGGQALPEGVLVRTPTRWAVAIRRPSGEIYTESHPVSDTWPRLRRTFLRGFVAVADAITIGTRGIRIALRESSGVEVTAEQFRTTLAPVVVGALGVFVVVPAVLSARWAGTAGDVGEAIARALMLLVYISLVSRSAQTRRLLGYHGAEHMAIAAYEITGRTPALAEVRRQSPVHPRCGTNFIALFVIVSGVVFSFVPRHPLWWGGLVRVVLVPVVAALAYEVMRAAARGGRELWARAVTWPGRALQRLTTRQPDELQIEVAIKALEVATRL